MKHRSVVKNSWIMDEAIRADGRRGIAILEDPVSKRYLDNLLLKNFWPFIRTHLRESGYSYTGKKPETELSLAPSHERSFVFMLFDQRKPIFRGTLKCSRSGWMLESDFFLLLRKTTDPRIIFEVMGNSRLCGNPPKMSIHKDDEYYYQIMFNSGQGAGWGLHDEDYAKQHIAKVIKANVEMYDMVGDGILTSKSVGPYLSTAYEAYESF